jgi:two-component system, NarL family, response regulator NreC
VEQKQVVRVLLADDHAIVREGVRMLLAGQPGIEVIGEVADGRAAVTAVGHLRPDVVVMDLGMPEMNGVEATRVICRDFPGTQVLVLSMYSGEEYVRPAIRAGASGYLLKGSAFSELLAAIAAVARGGAFFSPAIAKLVLVDSRRRETHPADALTNRECEILRLVVQGQSSNQIARDLGLSMKTVEGHRGRIMAKLDVHHLAGLVKYAVRAGLVSPDP